MGRLTYYQVHKNKRQKKIIKPKKVNLLGIKIMLSTVMLSVQHHTILAQPNSNRIEKAKDIFENIITYHNIVKNIIKEHKKEKYLNRVKRKKK